MRGSRTFSMPIPMRWRSLGRLTRRVACRVRSDHPSVTLPLIPSAPSRQRTARSERPSRRAIFCHWFVSSQFQQLVIVRRCPWHGGRPSDWTRSPGLFALVDWPSAGPASSGVLPQMSDTLPTILTGPSRDKLKDSVDRVALLGRPLLDPSNQQLIDRSQLLARLITLLSRSTGHCATSLQADPNRELALARLCEMHTGREHYSRSIQSEVGCGYQRGATFVVPHFFPLDEGAPDHSAGPRRKPSLHLPARDCRCSCEAAWPTALLSGDARSAVYCPTLTKGTSGREKYQKKVIA